MKTENLNDLNNESEIVATTHWPIHPICDLFPKMTPEERAELKQDMKQRAEGGIDPLEHPILIYQQRILDGRHRDEIWMELANENACNGFFRDNLPPHQSVSDDGGNLVAWMRAKSANIVYRHIPADQKTAIFLKAVDTLPELKARLEQIKEENAQRQKDGTPLDASDQRGDTNKETAKMIGVGTTVIKAVKKLKTESPDKFDDLVQGKTTAKKSLEEIKLAKANLAVGDGDPVTTNDARDEPAKQTPANRNIGQFKVGDVIYEFDPGEESSFPCIGRVKINSLSKTYYLTKGEHKFRRDSPLLFENLKDVKGEWKACIQERIADLEAQLKAGPEIEDVY